MGLRGPPPWEPTKAEREMVQLCTALGYTQAQVALLAEVSVDSLQRYCRKELDTGALLVNMKVGGKLFQKAMGGDTAALIFWAKTRLGWSEKQLLEHSGAVNLLPGAVLDDVS